MEHLNQNLVNVKGEILKPACQVNRVFFLVLVRSHNLQWKRHF